MLGIKLSRASAKARSPQLRGLLPRLEYVTHTKPTLLTAGSADAAVPSMHSCLPACDPTLHLGMYNALRSPRHPSKASTMRFDQQPPPLPPPLPPTPAVTRRLARGGGHLNNWIPPRNLQSAR